MNITELQTYAKTYGAAIARRHVLIVSLSLLGALAFTVFTINTIISGTSDTDYFAEQQAKTTKTTFDEQTIDAVNRLRTPSSGYDLTLPDGRINPFAE